MLAIPDPLTARYLRGDFLQRAAARLSDETLYLDHCVAVELALLEVLADRGFLEAEQVAAARQGCKGMTMAAILAEEERVRHDLKAVVNVMVEHVPESVRPFIHLGATSYDILSNAHALRLREGVQDFLLPTLREVARQLIRLAEAEAGTPAIGRTHGQFAEPITFGYNMAVYLDRLGGTILGLEKAVGSLRGKFSGAVGAYVALGLLFDDPREVERQVLARVGLEPNLTSTQIVHPEPALRVYHHVVAAFGVLANLADDLRNLQRSEVAEVAEEYRSESQVGSSAMPHKQNPITWENIKSLWKTFMPGVLTLYMDQISEHQRDLTNSASARFYPRLLLGLLVAGRRASRGLSSLVVNREQMESRLLGLDNVTSGPAQTLLSSVLCPDAHERVRLHAIEPGPLMDKLNGDLALVPFLEKLRAAQLQGLEDPRKLTGPAKDAALETVSYWTEKLSLTS